MVKPAKTGVKNHAQLYTGNREQIKIREIENQESREVEKKILRIPHEKALSGHKTELREKRVKND